MNKKILITDWADLDQVLPIASKYQVGIEVLEFAMPENLIQAFALLPEMQQKLNAIPLIGLHGPFSELIPASRDPWVRQVARSRCQQGYELAQLIGAKHLILHSGYLPKTYPRDQWIQNSLNYWLEFLGDKDIPNMIHLENVYEDDFSTLAELTDQVNQAFQGERLTICLDIGHVNANSSISWIWIRGLGDDPLRPPTNNDGILDDHWSWDKGKIDVSQVVELLKHSSYLKS
jgi:sugar phosphate isomerase/epimerase